MMELNFLRNPHGSTGERRIELWRRAIFLFDITEAEEGPFHQANYEDYWCEGRSQEKLTPDIFGFSENFFCVCDISMSPQKGEEMKKYQNCTPSAFMKALFPAEMERKSAGDPFLITDALELVKVPGYNLLQVYQPGEAFLENVVDDQLKRVLENWGGFITPPPSYSLLAVPETTLDELKSPMAGILKWASIQDQDISTNEVVEKLLGKLYTSISEKGRGNLRTKVEKILYDLWKGPLKEYLKYDQKEKKFIVEIDVTTTQSRKAFSDRLNTWLNIQPIERFIPEEDNLDDD